MALSVNDVHAWAGRLAAARATRVGCDPITASVELSLDDAYAIQNAGTARRLARGERIVGWKLGYTSVAMRTQMGIDQPNFGPLTDVMLLGHDELAGPTLIQPRVEPEIGLRFARPIHGEVSVAQVLAAVGEAFACLEIVDSVYPGYRFRLEDNTADGSSAAQVVVGPALRRTDRLDEVTVELVHCGTPAGSATGSAASGHPALGVVWLVAELARRGRQIEAGDLVITGGLTKAVALEPGDTVEAVFDGEVHVAVRRAPAESPNGPGQPSL